MNDRYLYRAKRTDNGEWVEGYYAVTRDKKGLTQHNILIADNDLLYFKWRVVDQSTVCQCTGLKDKNGHLIWENYIVAYWDSYSTESGLEEADFIGKVVWYDETISLQVTNRLSAESYEVLGDECSVIGNVFDNPELLEK